ncbi:hypothetical protein D3C77_718830 [compost metagenome]
MDISLGSFQDGQGMQLPLLPDALQGIYDIRAMERLAAGGGEGILKAELASLLLQFLE